MRAPIRFLVVSTLLIVLSPGSLSAQFRQYTPPGGTGDRAPSGKQAIEQRMANARWRLGPVRLEPWFGLQDAAWIDDVFAASEAAPGTELSDFTATVGAGLTALMPTGSNLFWVAQAQPTYVWWQDLEDRRQLAGTYGAGVLGFWNRLETEVRAERREDQGFQSLETTQLTVTRRERVSVSGQLRLSGAVWFFAGGQVQRSEDAREDDEDLRSAPFSRLDREETSVSGGLAWTPSDRLRVALGVEATETDLDDDARDLSNDDLAPILQIQLGNDDATLSADVDLALRSIEAIEGSRFTGYDELAGEVRLRLAPGWRISYELYGLSQPVLSLQDDYSHYEEHRFGLAVEARVGREASLQVYGDVGDLDYQVLTPEALPRTDDLTAWGARFTLPLGDALSLETGWQRLELDSDLPGLDRESNQVTLRFGLRTDRLLWR